MSLSGTVKFFDMGKGFGFITQNNGGSDCFVHVSNVTGKGLNEGDQVQFEVETGEDGRSRAVNVSGGTREESSYDNNNNRGGNRGYGNNEGGYGGNSGGGYGGNSGGGYGGNRGGGQGICNSFRDSGECRFGDRCRFTHQQN